MYAVKCIPHQKSAQRRVLRSMCKVSRKLQFTKDVTPYTLPPVLFSSLFRFLGKVLAQCTSHVVETGKSCRDMLDSQFDYDRWAHGQRRSGHEVGKHVSSLSELLFHFRIFFEACFSKCSLFSQFLRTAAISRSLAHTNSFQNIQKIRSCANFWANWRPTSQLRENPDLVQCLEGSVACLYFCTWAILWIITLNQDFPGNVFWRCYSTDLTWNGLCSLNILGHCCWSRRMNS